MPPDPPSHPTTTTSSPTTSQDGFADVVRRNRQQSSRTNLASNTSITLYSDPTYEKILNSDPALLALARSQNPDSIIFDLRNLCTVNELDDLVIDQLGPVFAITTRFSKQRHLLAEVLFKTTDQKQKALNDGLIIKNERILGLPHLAADTNLVKVNLYQLPACNPSDLTEELRLALSAFGKVAQIRAYVSRKHHIFKGEATALLDISLYGDHPPKLQRFLHLEHPFPSQAMLCAKGMDPYCVYCKKDGHYRRSCMILRERRKYRSQVCSSCGASGHVNASDIHCANHQSPAPSPITSPSTTPRPSRPNTPTLRPSNFELFDTYMADRRHGTSLLDSQHAPTHMDGTQHIASAPNSPNLTAPTLDWADEVAAAAQSTNQDDQPQSPSHMQTDLDDINSQFSSVSSNIFDSANTPATGTLATTEVPAAGTAKAKRKNTSSLTTHTHSRKFSRHGRPLRRPRRLSF